MKNLNHKNKIYHVLFISIALLFQNCELFGEDNDTPQLPEATQSGKGTFGYIVNGEVVNITNTSAQVAIYQGGFIQFGSAGVYIVALDPFTTGVSYEFKDIGEGVSRAKYTTKVSENKFCLYEYKDTYEGFVKFTKIDRVNYIISGTFEFSTKTDDCEDIKITQGVFDLKYIP
ncbi:MAG: hypothetical protein WAO74_04665 [Polaribacter sp.]|uniref:hypothetical protein n=1 Tax=Polaribacter sp. TaxID=1920175 RepID=UPI003BAE57FC